MIVRRQLIRQYPDIPRDYLVYLVQRDDGMMGQHLYGAKGFKLNTFKLISSTYDKNLRFFHNHPNPIEEYVEGMGWVPNTHGFTCVEARDLWDHVYED